MKKWIILLAFFTLQANAIAPYKVWLQELRQEVLAEGINPKVFDEALANWQPKIKVVKLDRNQPEKRITFNQYKNTRANKTRVAYGRRAWKKHHNLLQDVSKDYGVDPCIIAAIWGIETSYGNYMGKFPVVSSLATLAYDGRRSDFFRKELILALHIINDGHISHKKFVGEWAGGSGHPQFLPSSWMRYAKDYDNDGYKDIWNNLGDVFASIANYLKENGWQSGQLWGAKVKFKHISPEYLGLKNTYLLSDWQNLGIRPKHKVIDNNYPASLVQLEGGPLLLVFPNFKVIMRYNRSVYYAGTVGYLADQICQRPGVFS